MALPVDLAELWIFLKMHILYGFVRHIFSDDNVKVHIYHLQSLSTVTHSLNHYTYVDVEYHVFPEDDTSQIGFASSAGHMPGAHHPTLEHGYKDFMVIHMNGIHSVGINFCHCHSVSHHKQLLCIVWWPVTMLNPKTCATMECLQQLQLLNLKANVTMFGYYGTLLHMMDNICLEQILVSYSSCLWHSILTIMFRINFCSSCSWHVNSGIWKCWSAVHMPMILEGYQLPTLVLSQSLVECVLSQTSIYLLDGRMFPQQECMSNYFIVYCRSCSCLPKDGSTCSNWLWMQISSSKVNLGVPLRRIQPWGQIGHILSITHHTTTSSKIMLRRRR